MSSEQLSTRHASDESVRGDTFAGTTAVMEPEAARDVPVYVAPFEPVEGVGDDRPRFAERLRILANRVRPFAIVAAFVIGIVAGIVAYGVANPGVPPPPWPALPGIPEPADAHAIADALRSGDATTLAHLLDSETLTALGTELDPITKIVDVQFLGSVGDAQESFSAYLVHGSDSQGTKGIGGFVLHSAGGHVVAVDK